MGNWMADVDDGGLGSYCVCGTVAVNSSSIFVSKENAGRTGYSWSVMTTA